MLCLSAWMSRSPVAKSSNTDRKEQLLMSKTIFTSCAALTALLISSASVARPQQGLIVHKALSLDMAMAMTQGSLAKCREMHYKCAITVLDATGRTIIALQDDGANLHRFDVAR